MKTQTKSMSHVIHAAAAVASGAFAAKGDHSWAAYGELEAVRSAVERIDTVPGDKKGQSLLT